MFAYRQVIFTAGSMGGGLCQAALGELGLNGGGLTGGPPYLVESKKQGYLNELKNKNIIHTGPC